MTAAEKTALAHRVLSSIGTHRKPADADILLLHLHYPQHDGMDADELACLMILDLAKERRAPAHTNRRPNDETTRLPSV